MSAKDAREFLTGRGFTDEAIQKKSAERGVKTDQAFIRLPTELEKTRVNAKGKSVKTKTKVSVIFPNKKSIDYETYRNYSFFRAGKIFGDDKIRSNIIILAKKGTFLEKVEKSLTEVGRSTVMGLLPEAKERKKSEKKELFAKPEGATDVNEMISMWYRKKVEIKNEVESTSRGGAKGTRSSKDKLAVLIKQWQKAKKSEDHEMDLDDEEYDEDTLTTEYLVYTNAMRVVKDEDGKRTKEVIKDEFYPRLVGKWNVNLAPNREKDYVKLQAYGIGADTIKNLEYLVEKLDMMDEWNAIKKAFEKAKAEKKGEKVEESESKSKSKSKLPKIQKED